MNRPSPRVLLAPIALAAAAVLLASCSSSSGGGDDTSAPSDTGGSSASTSTPASSAQHTSAAPNATQLKKLVLQANDLPASWKSTPYQPDPKDAQRQAALAKCVGAKTVQADMVAQANSPEFTQPPVTVTSDVTSFKSQSDVDAKVQLLDSPKVNSCYRTLAKGQVATSLPAGTSLDRLDLKVTPGTNGGPRNVVAKAQGVIRISVGNQHITEYLDVMFLTGPRVTGQLEFVSMGTAIPANLENILTKTVATRVGKG